MYSGSRLGRAVFGLAARAERLTGIPAFASATVLVGILGLALGGIGLVTDVATHIDNGRDDTVFAPSHDIIVLGLVSMLVAALLSLWLYPQNDDRRGVRIFGTDRRAPYGGLFMVATVVFALIGFPLDYVWHGMFGEDVTLWSPTHATMISGGSFSVIGLTMLLYEARRSDAWRPTVAGRAMVPLVVMTLPAALSVWQGEFDYGVPQFQALFLPTLVVFATAAGLIFARLLIGRGGALAAVAFWLVVRAAVCLLAGPVLGFTVPRFFPYVAEGILVELAFLAFARRSAFGAAALSGLLIGTVGVASTFWFSRIWAYHELAWSTLPEAMALGSAVGVSLAVLVFAAARSLAPDRVEAPSGVHPLDQIAARDHRRSGAPRPAVLVVAGIVLLAAFAAQLPRNGTAADLVADVDMQVAHGAATVTLSFADPSRLRRGVDWFEGLSWQGGGRVIAPMVDLGGGRYRTSRPLPITGSWKAAIRLADGRIMRALPVRFPADPDVNRPAIIPADRRAVTFRRESAFMMREYRGGDRLTEVIAYTTVGLVWLAFLALAVHLLGLMGSADRAGVSRTARRAARGRKNAMYRNA